MNNVFRFALLLFFFTLAQVLPACGEVEEGNNAEQNELLQVTGRVRLVGNMPYAELVITGTDGQWHIDPRDDYKLRQLQQQIVTVEGTETVEFLRFASGIPAGERRTLENIRVISIE
jgi:tRNA A37 methylthiotransferase MiaB